MHLCNLKSFDLFVNNCGSLLRLVFSVIFLLVIGVFLDIDFSVDFGGNAGTGLMIQLKKPWA
jgi:hypothetical protein